MKKGKTYITPTRLFLLLTSIAVIVSAAYERMTTGPAHIGHVVLAVLSYFYILLFAKGIIDEFKYKQSIKIAEFRSQTR